jgi:DNA/RNA-binding domain of Phe-tRNA-synthetase-like protein
MTFVVAEECKALGLVAGAVVFRNVRVEPSSSELKAEIAREAEGIRQRFTDPREVGALPEVVSYQEVLRKVGVKGRRERPSVERLLSFALRHGTLPAINSLVDAYNLVSVRTLCSLGAHDLDAIAPPVSLRLLTGEESFTPLGGDRPVALAAGEFGYVDAAGRALCRLDVLQADFSKVTPATTSALLIVEGTTAHAAETLRRAFDEVVALVGRSCGGEAEVVSFPASGEA